MQAKLVPLEYMGQSATAGRKPKFWANNPNLRAHRDLVFDFDGIAIARGRWL
jgi:hypothetical protein